MRQLAEVLFLPGPKTYPKFNTFQDLKAPKHLLQEMFFLIMS